MSIGAHSCNLSTKTEVEYSKFEVLLGYRMRPCLKKEKMKEETYLFREKRNGSVVRKISDIFFPWNEPSSFSKTEVN